MKCVSRCTFKGGTKTVRVGSGYNEYTELVVPTDANNNPDTQRFNLWRVEQGLAGSDLYQDHPNLDTGDLKIHWVWLKTTKPRLNREYLDYANTWIQHHPDATFFLWTNLADSSELEDFIADIKDQDKRFFDQVTVKYHADLVAVLSRFGEEGMLGGHALSASRKPHNPPATFQKAGSEATIEGLDLLGSLLDDNHRHHLLFKHDLLRLMIIYLHGGIYCDFNDCRTETNLAPYYHALGKDQVLLPRKGNEYNNFVVGSKPGNQKLANITLEMLQHLPGLIVRINDPTRVLIEQHTYDRLRDLIKGDQPVILTRQQLYDTFNVTSASQLRSRLWPSYLVIKYHLGHHQLGDAIHSLFRRRGRQVTVTPVELPDCHDPKYGIDLRNYIMISESVDYVRMTNLGKYWGNRDDCVLGLPYSDAVHCPDTRRVVSHYFNNTSYGIVIPR